MDYEQNLDKYSHNPNKNIHISFAFNKKILCITPINWSPGVVYLTINQISQ